MDLLTKEEKDAIDRIKRAKGGFADDLIEVYGPDRPSEKWDDDHITLAAALVRLAPFLEAAGPVVEEALTWDRTANAAFQLADDVGVMFKPARSSDGLTVAHMRALVASVSVHADGRGKGG